MKITNYVSGCFTVVAGTMFMIDGFLIFGTLLLTAGFLVIYNLHKYKDEL